MSGHSWIPNTNFPRVADRHDLTANKEQRIDLNTKIKFPWNNKLHNDYFFAFDQ
jgi:hypothetical protein